MELIDRRMLRMLGDEWLSWCEMEMLVAERGFELVVGKG